MIADLFWRWLLVGALAFGGGQAALSLVERTAVTDTGWITPADFSTALAFSFVTPGPVLILATFIGYRVAGIGGAVAATLGVFLVPWFLATAAAHLLRRAVQHPWLRGFGRGAGPAVTALLVVSALSVTRTLLLDSAAPATGVVYLLIALAACVIAVRRAVHPFGILAGGAVAGAGAAMVLGG